MRRSPMPDTRPQLTHGHKSARLASRSNNEGPSAFVLKGHSRTQCQAQLVVASDRRRRLGSAAADSIPACSPEVDLPALCRRRLPETVERDLIGPWLLPRLRSARSPVAPNLGGGDLDDRDRSGRAQALADGG